MNIIEEDQEVIEKKTKKSKKFLIIVVVLIILLLMIAAAVWVYAQKLANEALKVVIDNTSKSMTSDTFIIKDGKVYTSVSDICKNIGYSEFPGKYKQYVEGDLTNCYASNSKEVVTFSSGSSIISKYELLETNSEPQTFDMGEAVFTQGNKLYINEEGLKKAFNLLITYTKINNKITIQTLPFLVNTYIKQIPTIALNTSNENYVMFNNEKALLYGFAVLQDPNTKLYGMSLLSNVDIYSKKTSLSSISSLKITARYKQLEFVEGSNDFIATTSDGKVGILGNDGITKVGIKYDQIKELDKDSGLYIVTSSNKQGVINQNGKMIVYQDYDQIGLDNAIADSNVTNRYLLYGKCIPVKLNQKWGLYDTSGNRILPIEYDEIGCSSSSLSSKNAKGIILIPDVNAIVIAKDVSSNNSKIRKYGLIDSNGQAITQLVLDDAYTITAENKTTYYMTYQNQAIDIVNFIYEQKANQGTASQSNQVNNSSNTLQTVNSTDQNISNTNL